ncbi:hypothetical protein [Shewanella oncorhynchi]|uniref:hypothetical protein n=1 Tax=Shewanella oncorhynchi TaxID=2726434 RepID=UPI002E7B4FE4|nr:hypothetical protein [Shewanella oncorhynchi]WVI91554.1 hypothetical protein VR487_11930 [Shewanella oncorhynchi]
MQYIMKMKKVLLLLSIAVNSVAAYSQNGPIEAVMQANKLTEYDLEELPMLQFFSNPYVVSKRGSEVLVSTEWPQEHLRKLQVASRHYQWVNGGEFGGRLELATKHGSVEILKGNIVDLLPMGDETLVISGLAHLSMRSGAVHVISELSDPPTPTFVTKLPDAPTIVYLDDERKDYPLKVVVGSMSLMSLDPHNNVDILYWDAFWSFGLEPTSIVRYMDHYLIGLPHGIAVIPAPWGPTSNYCRSNSSYRKPDSCTRVRFYADEAFRSEIKDKLPLYTQPAT